MSPAPGSRLTRYPAGWLLALARTSAKGYEHLHGYKIRFETTWLDKPYRRGLFFPQSA